jgi:hypothetical protein
MEQLGGGNRRPPTRVGSFVRVCLALRCSGQGGDSEATAKRPACGGRYRRKNLEQRFAEYAKLQ